MPDSPDCAVNPSLPTEKLGPEDWWDVSQVDGWTLPYKVEIEGKCDGERAVADWGKASVLTAGFTMRSTTENRLLEAFSRRL
ncbi:MAG: hypothetical protein SGPRY_001748, partial [Prymnesium sp.]